VGWVAQLVECRIVNPMVAGSNPVLPPKIILNGMVAEWLKAADCKSAL
jgi:hypothetical protein